MVKQSENEPTKDMGRTRSSWLCEQGSPRPLPRLPVLNATTRGMYPEWHRYLESVYASPVMTTIDLNAFEFFYWSAPLVPQALYRCDWEDRRPTIAFGTPWIGGTSGATFGPEHLALRVGFFVYREIDFANIHERNRRAQTLEVLRVGPDRSGFLETWEVGRNESWFFLLRGTGIFLTLHGAGHYWVDHTEVNPMTSAPRAELVVHHRSSSYWPPEMQFTLGGGGQNSCNSTLSSTLRVLHCSNRRGVPLLPHVLPVCHDDDGTMSTSTVFSAIALCILGILVPICVVHKLHTRQRTEWMPPVIECL